MSRTTCTQRCQEQASTLVIARFSPSLVVGDAEAYPPGHGSGARAELDSEGARVDPADVEPEHLPQRPVSWSAWATAAARDRTCSGVLSL
jgi:hypothetical protein